MQAFFYSWPGLGDTILSMPIVRFFSKLHYNITLFCYKDYTTAFNKIPYISSVLPFEDVHIVKSLYQPNDIFVMPYHRDPPPEIQNLNIKIISRKHKYSNFIQPFETNPNLKNLRCIPFNSNLTAAQRGLIRMGIDTNDSSPEIGFEQYPTNLPPNTILINFGSYKANKHLHPKLVTQLHKELSKDYNVAILQGPNTLEQTKPPCNDFHKILSDCNIQCIPMNDNSLLYYLNLIKDSKLFISTDGGLLHAAVAMKHPLIYLETYYPQHLLFQSYPQCKTITPQMRCTKCKNGCTLRDDICYPNEYSVECLTNCDIQPIINEVKFL